MAKLLFSYLLYLSATLNALHLDSFFQKVKEVKCCKPNEILSEVNNGDRISYACKSDKSKTLSIEALAYQLNFSQAVCVDVLEKLNGDKNAVRVESIKTWKMVELNMTFLPKCCPIHYAYYPLEHRCIESVSPKITREFISQHNKSFALIKSGMGDCRSVIADYENISLEDILTKINSTGSLNFLNKTFEKGSYCFDELFDSNNYVVRVCHADFNECRMRKYDQSKVRCIRKCCPDGKSYISKSCEDDLYQGFNFINDTRVKNPKEPFAIIVPIHSCNKFMSDESDEYSLDEKGHIRFILEENPPVYYSPFKESYCYENINHVMHLFICLNKVFGNIPSADDDIDV